MDLENYSKETGIEPQVLARYLKEEKKIRIFSYTYRLSDSIIAMLDEHFCVPKQESTIPEPLKTKLQSESGQKNKRPDVVPDTALDNQDKQNNGLSDSMLNVLYPETALLRKCIRDKYHILIDTCSILRKRKAFELFYIFCKPLLVEYHMKLEVPYSVVAELGRIIKYSNKGDEEQKYDPEIQKLAVSGYETLKQGYTEGIVDFIGDRNDTYNNSSGNKKYFADARFLEKILLYRNNEESVLLITQDHRLTKDVVTKIASLSSVKSTAEVLVRKLNGRGHLVEASDDPIKQTSNSKNSQNS